MKTRKRDFNKNPCEHTHDVNANEAMVAHAHRMQERNNKNLSGPSTGLDEQNSKHG